MTGDWSFLIRFLVVSVVFTGFGVVVGFGLAWLRLRGGA
jgi:hypothetical protein